MVSKGGSFNKRNQKQKTKPPLASIVDRGKGEVGNKKRKSGLTVKNSAGPTVGKEGNRIQYAKSECQREHRTQKGEK